MQADTNDQCTNGGISNSNFTVQSEAKSRQSRHTEIGHTEYQKDIMSKDKQCHIMYNATKSTIVFKEK